MPSVDIKRLTQAHSSRHIFPDGNSILLYTISDKRSGSISCGNAVAVALTGEEPVWFDACEFNEL